MTKITVAQLNKMQTCGDKIVALTAYDASFAELLDNVGIEIILVGDSLGMVLHGQTNTLGVTMEHIIYHLKQVATPTQHAMIVCDMPYKSYLNKEQALHNAKHMMDSGADMVKLERGDNNICDIIRHIVEQQIPVCAHLGLTPQSFAESSSYKVQGKDPATAKKIVLQATAVEQAGASMLVLECVPTSLATKIANTLKIPVIGIGAGHTCDGQVLVLYDILGLSKYQPKLAKNFLADTTSIKNAIKAYIKAVKSGEFPAPHNQFN